MKHIEGNIIDVHNEKIFPGIVYYSNGKIEKIESNNNSYNRYILPGLIDAHVHIESSMLVPTNFSRLIVPRGTIGVVTDPHEIGNVLGTKGVEYMIEDSKKTPLKCFFGAPSCVPATPLESSGAIIDSKQVEKLLDKPEVFLLSEMMNVPGVLFEDEEVLAKIKAAQNRSLPVDGHAPGVRGGDVEKYAASGISTDHECFTLEEAIDKIKAGIKIQIREGSAAKNFTALAPLFDMYPDQLMLCTDDSHPDELINAGHIDKLIKIGLEKGIDLFKLLRAASLNPVNHYNLPVGLLRENDPADFIVIDSPENFNVLASYINGEQVYSKNEGILFSKVESDIVNHFLPHFITEADIKLVAPGDVSKMTVIECYDGELVTGIKMTGVKAGEEVLADVSKDILKIVVVDRYQNKPVSVGFIKGFGFKKGAIASSVAHDSHNVVAVGTNDQDLVNAVNAVMKNKGGLSVVNKDETDFLSLPIAGLMSNEDGEMVAANYLNLENKVLEFGSELKAPFMTLSFMSLLVIPDLKIGDAGLFDGVNFKFISPFE